ncbi:MAG: N-methyl-L-tryptophan oxidase [Pirellulales bacterium]
MNHYDAIVLGVGGVGSAALYELARRGVRAIGIDRFSPPHDRGSSHGQTRIIRQAYFEHPDYVPLVIECYRLWHELERHVGRHLFFETGLVEVGPADGVVVPGVLRAAHEHRLAVEPLSGAEIENRWPGLRVDGDLIGVYEPQAGYLLVEECVRAHLDAAQDAGAELLADTQVFGWSAAGEEVRVNTAHGEIVAPRLIVTAGAWAAKMLADLSLGLTVRRKSLFWFETATGDYDTVARFPVFLFELPDSRSHAPRGNADLRRSASLPEVQTGRGSGEAVRSHAERGNKVFYGYPKLDARGVKVGEHSGGRVVDDPLTVDRSIDPREQAAIEQFLAGHLPDVSNRVAGHAVCLYTMSPDEHFIVDRHPAHANVVFAAGLSGHGFKFAPVLGRVLADLALTGSTPLPIGFLSLARFARST